jgi:hypothetical protein
MADYHVGAGQTYATAADAVAAIEALGSTKWTEEQRVVLHEGTYSETLKINIAYGWDTGASWRYPLVFTAYENDVVTIAGTSASSVYAGKAYMPNVRYENIIFSGGGYFKIESYFGGVTFKNCNITLTNQSRINGNTGSSYPGNGSTLSFIDCAITYNGATTQVFWDVNRPVYIANCVVSSTGNVTLLYSITANPVVIKNCRFNNVCATRTSHPEYVEITHTTFNGSSDGIVGNACYTAKIKNCIFKDVAAIFKTVTVNDYISTRDIEMDGNVYDNVTAFAAGNVQIADLAAAKALGMEGANSLEGSVTFQSTDFTNANFLKISESIGNAKNAGLSVDAFGTARERYDNIDAGAHQFAAVYTTTSTNPGIGNVLKDIEYIIDGVTLTGTFDEAVRNTNPGIAYVKKDVVYKIQNVTLTGEYDPSGEPPSQPTLSLTDSGDGVHATATVSGSDTGTTNNIYTAKYGTTAWTLSGTRTGNGTVTLTLDNGSYWAYCDSSLESCSSRSITAIVHIANLDEAVIVDIAEYIKDEINNSDISDVAERNYIQHERLEKITGTEIWVQPNEHRIERATRTQDQHEYDIDVSLFKRCKTTAETDDLVLLSEEIYQFLRSLEINGSLPSVVTMPTMFSPDDLLEHNLFAAVITVTVKAIS